MTYRNACSLTVSLILLSCSALSSLNDAWAASEPVSTSAPAGQPANPTAPSLRPELRQKAAAPAVPNPVPSASTLNIPVATISQDTRPTLDASTFINTMRAAWTYKRIAEAGGWPSLPDGTIMKAGDKGPLVPVLRQRLIAEGDLSSEFASGTTFDPALTSAVKRFQARHGLPESGAVRARTLAALSVSAATRHRQLTASAQRLASSTFPFSGRYVVVNIPSAAVEAVEQGQVVRRYVAIVGKAERPSPTVETRVTAVNLNPTWTVPVSLIKKDIIPHVRKDPDYLQKMKIRILDAKGQEVDPKAIDWSTQNAVNYTLRQDPGAINSLGQIRIDMPNKHAVYMHDTPKKQLFAQDIRFHSSGCVRVADVGDFAEWLLRGANGPSGAWTKADIDAAIVSTARQDIRLDKPVPVAWVYLTGYATSDGTVHFRDDVYGLDIPRSEPSPELDALDVPATASIKSKRL
ncbi:murein L,D-transpeptidase YcbB/YkuD [Microvirga lupini]|uniref:Murein L,D-transpeptidase YcbB/YkuD n=1 Tax=Microvirga lupini TaxID=420324 RepID=A0A7W4VK34_9HYPH|nr:L,D-transpeptidase family protein [Microvirga lupini]MBB3018256.1 murein L,D-transpeptidase YcbB/YkuD [Microvirga lupini]